MKTVIPRTPEKLGQLGESVVAKSAADGPTSIVAPLVKNEVKESIAKLLELTKRSEELRKQSELATEQRDMEA